MYHAKPERIIQIYSVYSACPLKYPIAASRQIVLFRSVLPKINARRSIVAVVHQSAADSFGRVISTELYKTYRLFAALRRDRPILSPVVHSKLITEFSERAYIVNLPCWCIATALFQSLHGRVSILSVHPSFHDCSERMSFFL